MDIVKESFLKDLEEALHTDKEGNGTYQNKCVTCGNIFFGHKRDTTCRRCNLLSAMNPPAPEGE
jgi:hypothetical protein